MPRPPRIVAPGQIVHVASRGAAGAPIFRDDSDRRRFLTLYRAVARRCDWSLLAFCLMTNHYHLLIEPGAATLSKGLQLINGQYASIFNDRHRRPGCVFQGRFWSGPVENDRHLHAVVRYIGLNPVAAGLCLEPLDWHWSGHRELAGLDAPKLVDVERTWSLLGAAEDADHRAYESLFRAPPDPVGDLGIRAGTELSWDQVKREVVRMKHLGYSTAQLAAAIRRDSRTVQRWAQRAAGDIRATTSGSDPGGG